MKKSVQISLTIFGAFLFLIFLSGFVVAAPVSGDEVSAFFVSAWEKWVSGDVDVGVAKLLLALLVTMVIYSVADMLPLMKNNEYVKWIFAVAGAILATFFLKSEEVASVLVSWSALGVTLGLVLPLIILGYLSFSLAVKPNANAFERMFNLLIAEFLWFIFIVATGYRIVIADAFNVLTFLFWACLVVLFFSLSRIFRLIRKIYLKEVISAASETQRKATAAVKSLARHEDELADGAERRTI